MDNRHSSEPFPLADISQSVDDIHTHTHTPNHQLLMPPPS